MIGVKEDQLLREKKVERARTPKTGVVFRERKSQQKLDHLQPLTALIREISGNTFTALDSSEESKNSPKTQAKKKNIHFKSKKRIVSTSIAFLFVV